MFVSVDFLVMSRGFLFFVVNVSHQPPHKEVSDTPVRSVNVETSGPRWLS